MADVEIFTLDGTPINVADADARQIANSANTLSQQNSQDIVDLKALSRLTVSYNSTTKTISFTTTTH